MTIRQKWNKYIAILIGSGDTKDIEEGNALIQEIEEALPFKNQKEHDKWLAMGENWNGEREWLTFTEKLLKRLDTICYHVCLPQNKPIRLGSNEYGYRTPKDYWITIKNQENASEKYIQGLAVDTMRKKVAIEMFCNPKLWKKITIEECDMRVEK